MFYLLCISRNFWRWRYRHPCVCWPRSAYRDSRTSHRWTHRSLPGSCRYIVLPWRHRDEGHTSGSPRILHTWTDCPGRKLPAPPADISDNSRNYPGENSPDIWLCPVLDTHLGYTRHTLLSPVMLHKADTKWRRFSSHPFRTKVWPNKELNSFITANTDQPGQTSKSQLTSLRPCKNKSRNPISAQGGVLPRYVYCRRMYGADFDAPRVSPRGNHSPVSIISFLLY